MAEDDPADLDRYREEALRKEFTQFCQFTQLADLVAYAALAKLRHERNEMEPEQQALGLHTLYDALPANVRNNKASGHADRIVRLG